MFFKSLGIIAERPFPEFLAYLFLLFIIYSFGGWIVECIWTLIGKRKFENRGFLFSPICPIYGVGSLLCVVFLAPLNLSWPLFFLLMIVLCDIIEYFTSVVLEKLYHVRWWDYTNGSLLHLNGRISLETSIGFGIGGLAIVYLVQPVLDGFLAFFSPLTLIILASILFIIFVADIIFSTIAIANVTDCMTGGTIDLTAEIKKFSINYYKKASRLSRKIARSAISQVEKAQKEAKKRVEKTFGSKNPNSKNPNSKN